MSLDDWVGEQVLLPTPIQDKVTASGITSLTGSELAAMPLEKLVTAAPGTVVSVDAHGWAMVSMPRYGEFGCRVDQLRRVDWG